jgi:hypothetical protein
MKRPDFIVQGVYNETPSCYRTGCLQCNTLMLLYSVSTSTMKCPDFIVQDVYNETPSCYRTGCLQ